MGLRAFRARRECPGNGGLKARLALMEQTAELGSQGNPERQVREARRDHQDDRAPQGMFLT